MGLLSGAGGLKGLLGSQDFGDSLAQAQDFLNGDYGSGMGVAARRFRRRGAPPIGTIVQGRRYVGGNPGEESSWPLIGGMAVGSGIDMPADFGSPF